ncbi:hypothetical protein RCH12_001550 [Cryobacterium sp. MP_3.1]|uniref:Cardiolipin synthase N-terminal domain-containing protein n=1 Tax=Cryobacterium zongtaii TaxID=1259217 RepID=A0A2S3ZFQ5_9MICO|nr:MULTISPECIES: PLD nuclease N-terminal domain-containing protein [Cryobacterium]MEC5184091.1 hypothetical protein [Cryobacterium sp. MP_3.1]POH65904.1 hypothetical protein C3B59_08650 [Cryobacterium zongtaii]
MYALFSAVLLVLIVAALVDIITRQDGQVKHLPKVLWVMLVIFLPVIGSLLWFAIGREYPAPAARSSRSAPRRGPASAEASAVLPARRVSSTEEELAALDREIDFHAEQARIRRLEAELAERRRLAEGRESSV